VAVKPPNVEPTSVRNAAGRNFRARLRSITVLAITRGAGAGNGGIMLDNVHFVRSGIGSRRDRPETWVR